MLTTILVASFMTFCACQEDSFTNFDIDHVQKTGTQRERLDELNFHKVCKCQCKDLTIFNKQLKRREGNCKTEINGKFWCFIPDEAAEYCRHVDEDPVTKQKYSFDACYTPPPGEGPCNQEESLKIDNEPSRNLSCCAVHFGKYDPNTFVKLVGIKFSCYAPNANQPDEGCEEPIETTWGPAKPCRCYGITYVEGARDYTEDTYVFCEVGVAMGSQTVSVSSTGGVTSIQVGGVWKRTGRCIWRKRPPVSGPWRCVAN